MGQKDKDVGRMGLSRRDFLKVSAVGAAAAATLEFPLAPAMAIGPDAFHTTALGTDTAVVEFHTTCPYCSASCGQIVAVGDVTGDVYDIYGDYNSPINKGGLCAKGAGGYQLATNARRLGAFPGSHPVNPLFAAKTVATAFPAQPTGWTGTAYTGSAHTYAEGVAYWRLGNGAWSPVPLGVALADAATKLVANRGTLPTANAISTPADPINDPHQHNSHGVAFFGSSHMNNEQNYMYRKLVANFGTTDTEHQARI